MTNATRPMQAGAPPLVQETAPVTPAAPPLPPTPAPRSTGLPVWAPLALSITLLILDQVTVALHTLPASTPITVALLVLTTLSAILVGVEQILGQQTAAAERMQATEHAHTERLAAIHARAA